MPNLTHALAPVLLAVTLPGCILAGDRSFTVQEQLRGIVIDVSNGDVVVTGHTSQPTDVHLDYGGVTFKDTGHDVIDGVLYINLDCGATCGSDVVIDAPQGIWLDARVQNGSIEISAIRGDIAASVGAGDLTLWDLDTLEATLATGAGSIDVDLLTPARSLVVDNGAGDVHISTPSIGYNLDLDAGAGSISLENVIDDPSSEAEIHASTGAGSIEIVGY